MSFFYTSDGEDMTIYVDVVLLLNFIIDLLLLFSVDILLKRFAKKRRIVVGALVGSLSTLLLFLVKGQTFLIVYKLVTSIVLVIISFGYKSFSYFKDNLFWLYVVSIILGGSIYLINDDVTFKNNALVFSTKAFIINFVILFGFGFFIVYKYIKLMKNYKLDYHNYMSVDIYFNNDVISDVGFLDTGNNLKDPVCGKPIILVDKSMFNGDVFGYLVPFKGLNSSGLLKVFKPDKVYVDKKRVNASIGVGSVSYKGIKIILNKEAL